MNVVILLLSYLTAVNLIGFALMGIDKLRAKKRGFRIPEATLFVVALAGGSIGSILGMYTFHHKTRHRRFVYGMPLILLLQVILVATVIYGPFEIIII